MKNRDKRILHIDTSSNEQIMVILEMDSSRYELKKKIGLKKAQAVLPMIDALLKKHSLTIYNISEIKVNTGPGSFTGIRVGIAVANAFSFALNIPINGLSSGSLVEPIYKDKKDT